ncbi:AraC family transcriptional regulator [Pedobacter sp. SD-b]|uniref:AraC family transcriptional regulator n=1 Tax=Pedobacter segetis TaxID=2793069 RepID=A0ABS1BI90_9SPHI|nr:AraC family transcriptional regulator [Pedobacter segetis]MBK0382606.1 AraC family transcriptional regulator [Pedobacter segetis]
MAKKKQGFAGQRIIDLSRDDIKEYLSKHPSSKNGYFTKTGFFPDAKFQFIEDFKGREDYILIYCIKGYGVANINYKTYHISPGDFFLIPSENAFSYYADDVKPWSIFWFFFKGDALEEIADLYIKLNHTHKGYLPYNEERIKLFNRIYQYLEQGYGRTNLTFMNMCLLNLVSSLVLVTDTKKKKEDKTQGIINSSIQLMKENCEKSLSLLEIAESVSMSSSHFSLVFKKATGISPINYFNIIKIQKACDYLRFTDLLVKEVAFKVGITDIHYFTRLFSKVMGITPFKFKNAKT